MTFYRLLADAIAVFHFAYVAFVVVGMVLIVVGIALRWRWVRNVYFRMAHFLMIAVVAAESLCRIVCPFTTWEDQLRMKSGGEVESGSFVGRWVHRLMFFEAPDWVFTLCYCLFGLAVLAALVLVPPNWRRRKHAGELG